MPTLRDALLSKAAEVVCELSAGQAEALARELAEAPAPRPILKVVGMNAPQKVKELGQLWMEAGFVDGQSLADAIRCGARAVKTASSYEKVELLYTGPDSDQLRRNLQGLLEVIRGARERLWVVSYVIVGVPDVLTALQERAAAGIVVHLLVDHRTENGEQAVRALVGKVPDCNVCVWPDEKRLLPSGKYVNLHAKCAVADGRQAFVSSANLTGWAMDHNLEVGYLVTGGETPQALARHLDGLLASGELVGVDS